MCYLNLGISVILHHPWVMYRNYKAVFSFFFNFFIPADTTRQPRPGEVNGKGELVAVGSVSLDSPNNSGFQSRALILGTLL